MSRVPYGRVGRSVIPICPIGCVLYLQFFIQSSKSALAINCAFYAFKWLYQFSGVDSLTLHPAIITSEDGALRLVNQPASHGKESLEVAHLKQLAETFATIAVNNLSYVRSRLFLFFSELQFSSSYVTFCIGKSKTNQLREGRSVVITDTRSSTCPCALHRMYMSKALIAVDFDDYLIHPISSSGNRKCLVSVNKPVSYSTY